MFFCVFLRSHSKCIMVNIKPLPIFAFIFILCSDSDLINIPKLGMCAEKNPLKYRIQLHIFGELSDKQLIYLESQILSIGTVNWWTIEINPKKVFLNTFATRKYTHMHTKYTCPLGFEMLIYVSTDADLYMRACIWISHTSIEQQPKWRLNAKHKRAKKIVRNNISLKKDTEQNLQLSKRTMKKKA